jgi:putative DNA primase/helicase
MAQAGKAQKGGQEVGMPDIPAVPFGSPYGAFESIHGYETSKEFAETLEADCKKYRGTAIDAFLTQLVIDRQDKTFDGAMAERVFKAAKRLAEGTTDLAVSRVANRFALVQVALELAHSYDILPFDFDRIEWAVKKMFDDWLSQRGGDGSIEVKKACDRIRHLITSNLHSDRMYDLKDRNVTQKVRNLLGYVNSDSEDAITEIWIPIPVFNSDVCQGVNKAQLIAELQKRGWLASPLGDERPTHQRRFKGKLSRFFVFLPPSFQDDEKTMGTVGTVGTASKNSSDKDSGDTTTVPIVKNGMGTVGTALPENAASSDNTPINEPEPEIDPDILTEF